MHLFVLKYKLTLDKVQANAYNKVMKKRYVTIRIRPEAHKKLKLLAAELEKSLIETIDYAATCTQNFIKTKPKAD